MNVRGIKRKKFGPVTVNLASDGFAHWRVTSWGLRVGPWSWNAKSGKHSIDIPGPWRWTSKGRNQR